MKKLLVLFLFWSVYNAFAQTPISNDVYKNLDIKNVSLEGLQYIRSILSQKSAEFDKFLKEQRDALKINTPKNLQDYLSNFNTTLEKAKNYDGSQQKLDVIRAEIEKLKISVLTNYQYDIPSMDGVNNLMTAFYQENFQQFLRQETKSVLDTLSQDVENLIKDRLNLLHTQSIDILNQTQENFKREFSQAVGSLPSLNNVTDNLQLIEDELVEQAQQFVEKAKKDGTLVLQKIENDVQKHIDTYQQNLKKIKDRASKNLDILANDFVSLTVNQEKSIEVIFELKKEWDKNQKELLEIEKQVKENVIKFDPQQHLKLLTQNDYLTNLISDYANKKFDINDKIEDFNKIKGIKEIFDDGFVKKVDDELSKLKNINTLTDGFKLANEYTGAIRVALAENGYLDNNPTLKADILKVETVFKNISKFSELNEQVKKNFKKEDYAALAQNVGEYAQATYETLVATGILKGKDAQKAQKWLIYANSAIQLGTGIGKMYSGDPSGFFNAMSGVQGFMGVDKKPQPSPEMQMLKHILNVMNQRLDKIDEKLDTIMVKIDRLSKQVYDMHISMMNSFQYIDQRLNGIENKLDYANDWTTVAVNINFAGCEALNSTLSKELAKNPKRDKLNFILNSPYCKDCITAMLDFTKSENLNFFKFAHSNTNGKTQVFIDEANNIYQPTFVLFSKLKTTVDFRKYINSLLFPGDINGEGLYNESLSNFRNFTGEISAKDYYNFVLINNFVNYYDKFGFLLELVGTIDNVTNFNPNNYLTNPILISQRKGEQEYRLKILKEHIEKAIIQQSMLSGNQMIKEIEGKIFDKNQQLQKDILEVLLKNDLLARNTAINYLHQTLFNGDKYQQYLQTFYAVKTPNSTIKVDSLDKFVNPGFVKHTFENNNIYLILNPNETDATKIVKAVIQDPLRIIKNQMIQSEGLNGLLKSREIIEKKLIGLHFFQGASSEDLEKFKYMYQNDN